ncbi:MAG: hypothetical protein SLAVMIC_00015 [uncultured marine phage]|uniref:Uncharacterized protein n=1 Tax=uncultured marine phage TaxID=707152 RepID=A0A8D9C875_9VIRU|nr:MAG: hypothetical protein SLAVMIC_00015 [uncultured marine phage]
MSGETHKKRKLVFNKENFKKYRMDFLVLLIIGVPSIIGFISLDINYVTRTALLIIGIYYFTTIIKKVKEHILYFDYKSITKSEFREDRLKKLLKKRKRKL